MIINDNSLQNMVQVTLFLVSLCFKVSLFVCVSVCVFAFLFVCSFVCLFIPSFVCSFVLSCSSFFCLGKGEEKGCCVELILPCEDDAFCFHVSMFFVGLGLAEGGFMFEQF